MRNLKLRELRREPFRSRAALPLPGTPRRGMGLVMALVIVLVSSVLVAFIFNSSSQFMVLSTQQRETYLQHARVTDYIETIKGMITDYNAGKEDEKALHRPNRPSSDWSSHFPTVSSARDLQIMSLDVSPSPNDFERMGLPRNTPNTENLSFDFPIEGDQAIRIQVYDLAYVSADIRSELRADWQQLSNLPAPLSLRNVTTRDTERWKQLSRLPQSGGGGDVYLPDGVPDVFEDDEGDEFVGAYMVRVELFDTSVNPRRRIRRAEEGFFQVVSHDNS